MNGQKPVKTEWPEIVENLQIGINNSEIQLSLFKAQLAEAETHIIKK